MRAATAIVLALLLAVCAALAPVPAAAQSRAYLDRDSIAYDEVVNLTVVVDTRRATGVPDVSALTRDFRIVSQRMTQELNTDGDVSLRVNMQLMLMPRRSGVLEIPMIQIGSEVTPPLRVTVAPPPQMTFESDAPPAAAVRGNGMFIDARVDHDSAYVQQTLGYRVRFYYPAGDLVDGRLDHDPPEGASLQKIGEDIRLTAQLGGRDYVVIERRFLLIPERSGTLTVPPPRFLGTSLGLFDSVLRGTREEMRVRGNPVVVKVDPIPAAAPQPWLPLRGLRLRYMEAPRGLRAGEGGTIVVEMVADAATSSQLPALALEIGDQGQVFAEPAQVTDGFAEGRPKVAVVRRFSVLPAREGTLRVVGPRIRWWDTQAKVARVTALPDLLIPVAAGVAGDAGAGRSDSAPAESAGDGARPRWWPTQSWHWAVPVLVVLWLGLLAMVGRMWWVRRRALAPLARHTGAQAGVQAAAPAGGAMPAGTVGARAPVDAQALPRALARGELGAIVQALCALAMVGRNDLDGVRARLADPAQRTAVDALQRARWGGGDQAATLAALRGAFAQGPRWRAMHAATTPVLLPPLYPQQ